MPNTNENIIEKVNISGTEYLIRDKLGGGFTGTTAEVVAAIQAGTITEGMTVYITDDAGTPSEHDAEHTAYDNTESGLVAENVQDAVDEIENSKVNKSGDTMTGNLTIKKSGASVQCEDMDGNNTRRKVWMGMANEGNWYIWDATNSKAILSSGVNASEISAFLPFNVFNTLAVQGITYTSGGIRNNGGWLDLYHNNVNKANLYVNVNDDHFYVRASTGSLQLLATNTNASVIARVAKDFAVGNENWTAGMPIAASAYNTWSTRLMKENIESLSEEDGNKLLDLRPVSFDFKESFGGGKDNIGLIAEEALEVIPQIVNVPEGYDESEFDESKGLNNKLLTVDYVKLTPYLIKLCQTQQKQIDALMSRVDELEKLATN